MLRTLKLFFTLLACSAVLGFFALVGGGLSLPNGSPYCFTLQSASSDGEMLSLERGAIFKKAVAEVKGECSEVSLSKEQLEEQYSASLVGEEYASGVACYYYVSPILKDFVTWNGKRVNLQIAVRGDRVLVGTPMIFGSF